MTYLIAQIAGRKRWTQINIPLDLAHFFGNAAIRGYVDVVPVSTSGKTFPVETRKFNLKRSINWTFGLSAKLASDSDHPGTKQPIAAFRQMPGGTYRYCILMPSHPAYAALEAFLVANYTGPARYKKRVLASVAEVAALYPACPL
jgi:hypothetical protein